MPSNGKQYTVTREMLTAVARDQSVQLKVLPLESQRVFQNLHLILFSTGLMHLFCYIQGCAPRILGFQPRDKAAMLDNNTIQYSLVPSGEGGYCSYQPTWPP